MVHMTPGDLPGLPVERLAQFLLGCAREDPTLLARSGATEVGKPLGQPLAQPLGQPLGEARPEPRPDRLGQPLGQARPTARVLRSKPPQAMPLLLREPGSRSDPELEELVSIAVACA